jgi:Protein of unknown function (DUF3352)
LRARSHHLVAVLATAAALALAGCGDDGEAGTDLASLVPPDVPLYAEASVRPEGDQRDAIESLTEQVAGIEDPGELLIAQLDRALAEEPGDFTYEEDIEPWLGERGAAFILSFEDGPSGPAAAAMVEVTDTDAAQEFIDSSAEADPDQVGDEGSYEGFDYLTSAAGDAVVGLVDDVLVVGTEAAFKVAVDAREGESLAESEEYTEHLDALADDTVGTVHVKPGATIDAAIAGGDVDPEAARAIEPLLGGALPEAVALGLTAGDDSATLEAVASVEDGHSVGAGSLLEGLPGDSQLALGGAELGPVIARSLDQLTNSGIPGAASIERRLRAETGIDPRRDVTPWLGDAAFFLRGTQVPGIAAGLVAETSDPQGPRKLVDAVQARVEAESGLRSASPPQGADYGFSVGIPGLGAGLDVGVADDLLIAVGGTTFDQVLEPEEILGDNEAFQAAAERLGDEFSPNFYLDVQYGLMLAERGADAASPDYDAARPYVENLGSLVAGARVDDDLLVSRLILTLAE